MRIKFVRATNWMEVKCKYQQHHRCNICLSSIRYVSLFVQQISLLTSPSSLLTFTVSHFIPKRFFMFRVWIFFSVRFRRRFFMWTCSVYEAARKEVHSPYLVTDEQLWLTENIEFARNLCLVVSLWMECFDIQTFLVSTLRYSSRKGRSAKLFMSENFSLPAPNPFRKTPTVLIITTDIFPP